MPEPDIFRAAAATIPRGQGATAASVPRDWRSDLRLFLGTWAGGFVFFFALIA